MRTAPESLVRSGGLRSTRWAIVLVLLLAAGCGDDETGDAPPSDTSSPDDTASDTADTAEPSITVPAGCHPLAPEGDCMLPFPSDYFRVDDANMPTGKRVAYVQPALPQDRHGEGIDPRSIWAADGASVFPHILALFPGGVRPDELLAYGNDPSPSIADTSPTVVLEADTGRRILHISELDPRADKPEEQALTLRVLEPLKYRTRYIVAIRGLKAPDGSEVPPTPAFAAMRDGRGGDHPDLAAEASRFDTEVFGVLTSHGVTRDDLIIAWDFTTGSQERPTHDMLAVRDLALAALATTPPAITVTEVVDSPNEEVGRRVIGTMTVPLYLDKPEAGAVLHRVNGEVAQNGTTEVPFTVQVPAGVWSGAATSPARVVQYGHGFFGHRDEIHGSFSRGFSQEFDTVWAAVDWWGMDETDRGLVATLLLQDPKNVLIFGERVHQGMVNQLALTRALETTLLDLAELKVSDQTVIDPSRIYWYGISQGHILGGTFMALTDSIERGVLGVGGAGFSHMMMRSSNFPEFLQLLAAHSAVPLEQKKFVALCQTVIDRWDPINYASWVRSNTLPGSPASRQLLLQVGLGDPQVPNLTARMHARALQLPLITPAAEPVVGLTEAEAPQTDGYVEFDYDLPAPRPGTRANLPEDNNDVHEGIRRLAAGRAQVDAFLQPNGMVTHTCTGPCDPE